MKKIGIVGYKAANGESFGVGISYLDMLSKFGEVKIIMPQTEFEKVDLLVLPGGLDTNPTNYGEIPSFRTSNSDVFKEFFFKERLKNYVGNTPILGICMGFQMLAVYFGSKLTQHFKWHPQSVGRADTAHDIWCSGSLREKFFFKNKYDNKGKLIPLKVNSFHHQGLVKSNLNKDALTCMAVAFNEDTPGDDIVEAFVHNEHRIFAFQDHPEDLLNDFHKAAINWLLED